MTTTADLVAGTVMDAAAALMNDAAKSTYTYIVQIPYLNMAMQELKEFFELNEVPVVATESAVIPVDAGVTSVGFSPVSPTVGTSYLPDDLIEISKVWERTRDTDPWVPMTKVDMLPLYMEGVQISQFLVYTWESQEIRFLEADADNDIKINYIKSLFEAATDEDSVINVINSQSFLQYRTAALLAEFVAENKTRADDLNGFASLGMDRVIGIGTKGRQSIVTRRRPFRNSYKRSL